MTTRRGMCIAILVGCNAPPSSQALREPRPRVRTSAQRAVQIAVGDRHSCARMADGQVVCWGSDYNQQLGGNRGTGPFDVVVEPTVVTELGAATQLAGGGVDTCVWDAHQIMHCIGGTEYGPVENNTTRQTGILTAPSGFRDVAAISLVDAHRCFVMADGTVACSGENRNGQLGDGTKDPIRHPTVVAGLANVVEVASSYEHTCARKSDGSVACWGDNHSGELGDGTTTEHLLPRPVLGLATARQISTASGRSCAVLADATVTCWGMDSLVGPGCGSWEPGERVLVPTPVPTLTRVAQVVLAHQFGCARMVDGTVRCWGQDLDGRLGVGAAPADALSCHYPCRSGPCSTRPDAEREPAYWFHHDPLVVPGLHDIVDLRVANDHACALDRDGAVWCWGANHAGQIGNGTLVDAHTPVRVRW